MQKRIIAITLSVALVLCSSVSVFAANGDTVDPVSSSGYRYQLAQNGTISYGVIISKWADMVTHITQSIAYSADYLRTSITTVSQYLNSYLFSNASTGYYLWDWTPTGGVYQGAPMGSQSVISQLRNMGTSLSKMLSYNTEYAYQLYQLLLNGGLVDEVKIKDNTSNGFSQAYFWKKWLSGSNVQLNTIDANGDLKTTNRFDFSTNSILGGIEAILYYYGNGLVTSASRLTQHVVDTSYATDDYLYDTDLVGTNMAKDSLWANVRDIGSNLSMHLSRLDYVLASDDEIAARQAAEDNQNAFVDNFLDSNGSGSASTTDLGEMAAGSNAIKNALSSNADASDAFDIFNGSGNVWDWFTSDTASAFDNVGRSTRGGVYTTYYSDYMDQVFKGINENDDR